jgi:hypothetical protein
LNISISTLHGFVRLRSLGKRTLAKRLSSDDAQTVTSPANGTLAGSDQKATDPEEVHRRIAALKARKPTTTQSMDEIDFEPTQPLRLITPRGPASDQ